MPKKREPTEHDQPTIVRHLGVGFTEEDSRILTELRHFFEKKFKKQMSSIAVIRICLRTQAEKEGIKCD